MPENEPTALELEVAATTGAAHALIALAATRAADAVTTPDSEGAEVVWQYAPDVPYVGAAGNPSGTQLLDAYLDCWYEVVHAGLTNDAVAIEATHPDGGWRIRIGVPQ